MVFLLIDSAPFGMGGPSCAVGHAFCHPGALALKMEAQPWNCKMEIFHPFRPPVGPGGGAEYHSNFHAPEGYRRSKGVTPVNGGPGPTPPVRGRCRAATEGVGVGGDLEHRNGAPRSRPPGAFLVPFWASKKKLAQ